MYADRKLVLPRASSRPMTQLVLDTATMYHTMAQNRYATTYTTSMMRKSQWKRTLTIEVKKSARVKDCAKEAVCLWQCQQACAASGEALWCSGVA